MRRYLHIFLAALAAALVLASCSGKDGGKVIPRSRMAKIYAEMLLTDQWVNTYRQYSHQADTSLVYEPIFERYGYDSDDFRASVAHYLKDTRRYGRLLKQSTLILEKKEKELKREKARLEALEAMRNGLNDLRPEKLFYLGGMYDKETFVEGDVRFYVDTTGEGDWVFDPYKGIDTLYQGPMLVIPEPVDTLPMPLDTLMEQLDTLVVRADTLGTPRDTLKLQPGKLLRDTRDSVAAADSVPSVAKRAVRMPEGRKQTPVNRQ